MMRVFIIVILLFSATAGLVTSLILHRENSAVYVEPEHAAHYPLTFVAHLKNDPQAGKKIYQEYCQYCHAENPEIPVHAPRIHHQNEWARFSSMNLETLFQMAAVGYGAMPARGGCFECSDKQLKQAIRYLLDNAH